MPIRPSGPASCSLLQRRGSDHGTMKLNGWFAWVRFTVCTNAGLANGEAEDCERYPVRTCSPPFAHGVEFHSAYAWSALGPAPVMSFFQSGVATRTVCVGSIPSSVMQNAPAVGLVTVATFFERDSRPAAETRP